MTGRAVSGNLPEHEPRARWQRVEQLFIAALEQPTSSRTAFLDQACAGDQALRDEVARLVEADSRAADFLEQSIAAAAGAADESLLGTMVGPYRLVKVLGRGGMSTVFLGTRADQQYRQRVAVKLLRAGLAQGSMLRRFLTERQILANLDHPNIARLLDGGVTQDGLPYVVMEFIDGEPITEHCDRRRLSINQRLHLFLQVCHAVDTAHRCLVVHRDLKPSNVLVTGAGEPKLLDFGIAKLLDPELAPCTCATTVDGFRPMTPGYASPEQLLGQTVTTTSDVYSLGVLLYELLTGQRPFAGPGMTVEELVRRVTSTDPRRPSTVVKGVPETNPEPGPEADQEQGKELVTCSANRSTRPELLHRSLRGDLDAIIMKALRREPQLRYLSVARLADDIERHLAGHPVQARRDTWAYRTSAFVRRHRFGVAAAALFAVLVTTFVVTLSLQAARIREERDRAQQVAAMLVDLFEIADPAAARGETITARDLLDRGVQSVQELDGQPATQAMLLETLAHLYSRVGLYDSAETTLRQAVAAFQQAGSASDPELATLFNQLARANAAQGRFDDARRLFQRAHTIYCEVYGSDHRLATLVLGNLALVHHDLGDYATAEGLYRQSIAAEERQSGQVHHYTLANMALLLHDLGRYQESCRLFERALAELSARLGPEHEDAAPLHDQLAATLHALTRLDEAEQHARIGLELRRSQLGPDHPDTARSLVTLGAIVRDRGRLNEAGALLETAIELQSRRLGEQHPELAASVHERAVWLAAQGRVEQAGQGLRRAAAIYRQALGDNHPLVGRPLASFAALLAAQGSCPQALALANQALALLPAAGHWTDLAQSARARCQGKEHKGTGTPRRGDVPVLHSLVSLDPALGSTPTLGLSRALTPAASGNRGPTHRSDHRSHRYP